MNRARLQFATTIFLMEMRRQAAKASKGIGIGNFDDYPPEQRSALMSAVEKAIKAADPAAEKAFAKWCVAQQEEAVTTK